MSRLRYLFWFLGGLIKKYYQWAILSFILGTLSLFLYFRLNYLLPRKNIVPKIGQVGRYTPDNLPQIIEQKISRGLTRINPDGSAAPDLANKWEIFDDGKSYLFYLKERLLWQDGSLFTTKDLAYNMKNVTLEPQGNHLLKVLLDEPFSPLPSLFSQPIFKKNFIGLGDYRLSDLKISNGYLQSLKISKDRPNQETLIYKFYPARETGLMAFKLGEIDYLEDSLKPDEFLSWPNVNINSYIDNQQFVAIYFDTQDRYLSQKTLRLALNYALENKVLQGERALGPLSPGSWAYNSQAKPYPYDLETAKERFEKFKTDVQLQEKLSIELATTLSQLSTAETIKKSWEKLNINVQIKVVSEPPKKFQAFLASRHIPDDPDQYSLWHSTQEANITHYASPKIDKLLEDGRKEVNQEKRKEIYLDFQRFLVEDSPAIFLFHPQVWTISRKNIQI